MHFASVIYKCVCCYNEDCNTLNLDVLVIEKVERRGNAHVEYMCEVTYASKESVIVDVLFSFIPLQLQEDLKVRRKAYLCLSWHLGYSG